MARTARPPRRKRQKGSLTMTLVTVGIILLIVIAAAVVALLLPQETLPPTDLPQQSETQPQPESSRQPALAEDDPSLWLTDDEIADAQPEELAELVAQRMNLCKT